MAMASISSLKSLGRTTSTNSLAQFYHEGGPSLPSSTDFCNAFWGPGDQGYEVLMARLRASGRTVEDLKGFWKERAAIEEEYAKRLSKLAKSSLGKDEVGDLRECAESLKAETEKQAAARLKLASEIRRDVESPAIEFSGRLTNLKKTYQASVEKSFKNKVAQEGYVAKARERYEQDCLRMNSFTANSSLVQGKELEKLQKQMEKVQASVGPNEREFKSYVKVLEETTRKWEVEWKGFCDHVQDLEEERLEFIKDNVWIYANAVSSVCVTDDESCERIRVSLENFESAADIDNFVKNYGTGSAIPDPPAYVDYSRGEAYTNGTTARTANFTRTTGRSNPISRAETTESPVPMSASVSQTNHQDLPDRQSMDGFHQTSRPASRAAMVNNPEMGQQIPRPPSQPVNDQRPPSQPPFGGVALPGMTAQRVASPAPAPPSMAPQQSSSVSAPNVRPPSAFGRPSSGMGMHAPQATGPSAFRSPTGAVDDDPVARSLANLRMDPPPAGSIRRGNSSRRPDSTGPIPRNSVSSIGGIGPSRSPGPGQDQPLGSVNNRMSYHGHPSGRPSMDSNLVPPTAGHTAADLARSMAEHEKRSSRQFQQAPGDFNTVADDVVGAHPASRPSTPSAAPRAPSPAFMQPPTMAASPLVDEVVGQYHQAFPGERQSRGPSRSGSVSSRRSRAQSIGPPAEPTQNVRSPSPAAREGFVGIGAGTAAAARSPSPQPFSPTQSQPQTMRAPSPGPAGPGYQRSHTPGGSYSSNHRQSQQYTSNPQLGSQTPGYGAAATQPAASQYPSYSGAASQPGPAISHSNVMQSGQYGSAPSAVGGAGGYAPPVQQYQVPPQTQPLANPYNAYQAPPQMQQPIQQGYGQSYSPQVSPAQPPYVAPVVTAPLQHGNNLYRAPSAGPVSAAPYGAPVQPSYSPAPASTASYYGQPQHQIPPPQQPQQNGYARAASPNLMAKTQERQGIGRSPSPVPPAAPVNTPPTGQYSTTGQPVLFYVKALYDYEAQSDAEFDFQVGDIIAVTNTPEDGWWSGELLDEARRRPGRNDFPSNFVCLF